MPLKVSMGAGEWIKHFRKSKNKEFIGKSGDERQQMALGAFYAAKRAGKENSNDILRSSYMKERRVMKPTQALIESTVIRAIFEDRDRLGESAYGVVGDHAYGVKVAYNTKESESMKLATVNARATSPEGAKAAAMATCDLRGWLNVSILNIELAPDSTKGGAEPTLSTNVNPELTANNVLPTAVSPTLSTVGIVLPRNASNPPQTTNDPDTSQNQIGHQ